MEVCFKVCVVGGGVCGRRISFFSLVVVERRALRSSSSRRQSGRQPWKCFCLVAPQIEKRERMIATRDSSLKVLPEQSKVR